MCRGYFFECSLITSSVLMLCIISRVCLSGMEAISLLFWGTSWITSKVTQHLKRRVIAEVQLIHVKGPVELSLLLRSLSVWPLDLNWRFDTSIICQVSVSREFQREVAVLGSKVPFRHFYVKWVHAAFLVLIYCYLYLFKWAPIHARSFGCAPHQILRVHLCYFGKLRKKNCYSIICPLKGLNFNWLHVLHFR